MSAEAITRYLRSKGDVNDICNQARRLVNAELEVTIPDATGFVLTLFCDRLNESQSKWRSNPEVWKTLGELWDKSTISQRSRIAKRLKIVEILTNVIAEGDLNVFQPMFEFMDKVVTKEYIAMDENQAISLLSVFTKCQVSEPLWVQVITALHQLHTTDVTYSQMSKKSYIKFITSCMSSIVSLNVKDNTKPFLQILRDVICSDNFASQFLTIWQKENLINQFSSETLNYLFELLISHFQSIDVSFCESLYRNFTTNNESNDESLLEILCRTQRPLSYQFFKDIYQREVKRPKLNINMIQYLFSLDVELAIEHATEIMHCVDQEAGTKLIPVITEAFVKGREANDFLLKVWPQAAEHATWWYADAITNQVSKFINDLTVRQLTSLMPELNDAVFTCVLEGLNDSGYQKIASVKEAVFKRVNNPDWKTIFMILCLYPEEKSKLKFPKFTTEPYCLWSNCRMIEIGTSVENINKMKSGLISILESNLAFVLKRWLPVAEYLGVSKEVVDLLFKLPVDDIRHQLQHAGSIIFELHNLTSAIVDAIIEHKLDELYTIIPPQAISKRQRRHAVETLSNIVTSTYSKPAVKALHHLLAIDATLQSPIESNFSNILLLLKNSEGDYINESFSLAQRIWNEHLRQMANQSCKAYVENAIDQLQDHEGQKEITPELRMTMVVLSASSVPEELSPRIKRLSSKFEKVIHNLLRKSESLDDETKAWLIWGLSLTSDPDVEEIIKTIKCLGTSTSSAVRRNLFRLVTKVYPTEIKDVVYILALFYSLTAQGVEDLTEDLSEYFSKTIDAVLTATVNFVVYSMSEISLENSEVFANIVKGLLSQITKSTNGGQAAVSLLFSAIIQGTNQMTPKALEIVLEAINLALIHKSWLFDQYTLEQVLLLVSKVSNILQLSRETEAESCYLKAIRVISSIVLLHRYRLSQRHHLLIASLTSLLVPLSVVRNRATTLSESRIAGESFARLLSNICEVKAITSNDTLTSEAALIKKELRKHLPVFMATYIHYSLKHNFREVVQQQLLPGIFTIFDLMSSTEMQLVNSTLDSSGKVYFKRLYNQYQDQGKWKDA